MHRSSTRNGCRVFICKAFSEFVKDVNISRAVESDVIAAITGNDAYKTEEAGALLTSGNVHPVARLEKSECDLPSGIGWSRTNPLSLQGKEIMQGDMHRGKEGLDSHGLQLGHDYLPKAYSIATLRYTAARGALRGVTPTTISGAASEPGISEIPNKRAGSLTYDAIILAYGVAVVERLDCSPLTKANRFHSPAGSLPYFRKWESFQTTPLIGGFSRGSPIPSVLAFRAAPFSLHLTLIGSPNLVDKIDVKHVYTEVDFAIGSQFIRHAPDDSKPIADLQVNK
ncbi:hypothetical protein PR048_019448 [Dryococelus australis]|uniref:FAD/NAD(P)-binding domain-containing protein n=1 Tax=Dryococelus australis TaxID=614101 RepID=A0ABQ9H3M7_9NEOP|nr:hypothetical protein PR048_019448 [Dryococelus australis]